MVPALPTQTYWSFLTEVKPAEGTKLAEYTIVNQPHLRGPAQTQSNALIDCKVLLKENLPPPPASNPRDGFELWIYWLWNSFMNRLFPGVATRDPPDVYITLQITEVHNPAAPNQILGYEAKFDNKSLGDAENIGNEIDQTAITRDRLQWQLLMYSAQDLKQIYNKYEEKYPSNLQRGSFGAQPGPFKTLPNPIQSITRPGRTKAESLNVRYIYPLNPLLWRNSRGWEGALGSSSKKDIPCIVIYVAKSTNLLA